MLLERGIDFTVRGKWDTEEAEAYAGRYGNEWFIVISGPIARAPFVTKDGLILLFCHEVGHHLGGSPKHLALDKNWAANEGQADYFATVKCFRRLHSDTIVTIPENVPPLLRPSVTKYTEKTRIFVLKLLSLASPSQDSLGPWTALAFQKLNSTLPIRPWFLTRFPSIQDHSVDSTPTSKEHCVRLTSKRQWTRGVATTIGSKIKFYNSVQFKEIISKCLHEKIIYNSTSTSFVECFSVCSKNSSWGISCSELLWNFPRTGAGLL